MEKKVIRKNIYYKIKNIKTITEIERIPWMKYAFEEIRRKICAISGKKSNSRIDEYFNATTNGKGLDDNTNWCGAFISWCFAQAGYDYEYSYNKNSETSKEKRIPENSCRAVLWSWEGSKLVSPWKKIKILKLEMIKILEIRI